MASSKDPSGEADEEGPPDDVEPAGELDADNGRATEDTGRRDVSPVTTALLAGLVAVVVLAALTGWLGFRAYQSRQVEQQREQYLHIGRQAAVNLTTLDYEHIDADVQRTLDSATGTFYDDFQQRAPAFVEVVKQMKSTSVGTVTAAALESDSPTTAAVLVAITVKTVIVGQPDPPPRSWRMRILVQRINADPKVTNVEFVP